VGESKTKQAAEDAALRDLVGAFRVDVEAITQASSLISSAEEKKGKKSSSYSAQIGQIQNEIKTNSSIQGLIGIQKEYWSDKKSGKTYALAYMNKKECTARYTALINENERLIETLSKAAETETSTIDACCKLNFAMNLGALTDNYLNILTVLAPENSGKTPAYGSAEAVRSLYNSAASAVRVTISVTGGSGNGNDRGSNNSSNSDSGNGIKRISSAIESVLAESGIRTTTAKSNYQLKADFVLKDDETADAAHKYSSFELSIELTDKSGAVLFSFSAEDRQGHTTQAGARQRAIREAENIITEGEFKTRFNGLLKNI